MHDGSIEPPKGIPSKDPNFADRYMIEIKKPGEKLDMPDIKRLLDGTGVELDPSYGPFLVNPSEGRHVVRGTVGQEAKKKLEAISGVTLFRDKRVIRPAQEKV